MRIKQYIGQNTWVVLLLLLLPALAAGCDEDKEPSIYPPTLVTSAATQLTRFDAVLTGTAVKNPASVADCEISFLFSTSASLSDARTLEATPAEEGKNQYTASIDNLTPGTKYYYCISANSGNIRVKGEVQEFATLSSVAPVLGSTTTGATSETTALLACIEGVKDDGGQDVSIRGFAYKEFVEGDDDPPTTYNKTIQVPMASETFSIEATSLKPNTRYVVRAYATNRIGTGYSEEVAYFTTETIKTPQLMCNDATEISAFTAQVSAAITNNFGFDIAERGFCYSNENNTPTLDHLKETIGTVEEGFAATLTSLNENTTYYVRAYAISEKGIGYSATMQFQTKQVQRVSLDQAPEITDITYTGATVSALINIPAGTEVLEKGICYSKLSTRPGIDGDHLTSEGGDNNSIRVTLALEEGTRYYVTAYATTQDGTFYSPATQFSTAQTKVPTLTAPVISDKDETFATATATIENSGDAEILVKGICWSDALSTPTVDNAHIADAASAGNSIRIKMEGLTAGTTYYVRAYAENKNGYAYSSTVTFSTNQTYLPGMGALSFTDITETAARASAEITTDGGTPILEYGICYSTTVLSPTINDPKKSITGSATTFAIELDGLAKGTTYHVRAYARNKNGTTYSMVRDLSTIENTVPEVSALQAIDIQDDNAVLQANIVSKGGLEILERGFVYSETNPTPTIESDTKLASTATTDVFTAKMEKLTYNTRYYIRAYARNALGLAYSGQTYFSTIATYTPSLNSPSIEQSSVTAKTAVVTGTIAHNGGAEVTEQGFWYSDRSSSTPDETNGIFVKGQAAGNGTFTATLSGLKAYTYYYVRAYAKNKNGIAFSSSYDSFTTLQTNPDSGDNPLPEPQTAPKVNVLKKYD